MVDPGGWGHVWLIGGVCMVAPRGACVVAQGDAWFLPGGRAWLLWGRLHGIRRDTQIRSMSGRYASYWNAFLLLIIVILVMP